MNTVPRAETARIGPTGDTGSIQQSSFLTSALPACLPDTPSRGKRRLWWRVLHR